MGKQIVQQPNGKFALWSSVVDDFIVVDYEHAQEIIDDFVEESRREITDKVNGIIAALHRGEKPYYQFTKSFEECVALIREIHGDDAESLRHLGLSR
jgi:hypothetical protein